LLLLAEQGLQGFQAQRGCCSHQTVAAAHFQLLMLPQAGNKQLAIGEDERLTGSKPDGYVNFEILLLPSGLHRQHPGRGSSVLR
jgi:hypothetical protein